MTDQRGGATMQHPMDLPTVHVVDDDDSFRTSVTRLLTIAGLQATGYRCAGEFLINQAVEIPGCILLDISMPGPSGVDLLKALIERELAPPIIFLTAYDDLYTTVDVMKAGAFDYIVKPVVAERLLPSIRRAMYVDANRRAAYREVAQLKQRFEKLTDVERAIFHGIMRNRLNKQLAADLGVCERTIKAQRARMMDKLNLCSIPDLVKAARMLESQWRGTGANRGSVRPAQVINL